MNTVKDFKPSYSELIESQLEQFCAELDLVAPLKEAIHHALFPKGKRIRPLIALSIADDLGVDATDAVAATLALELMHASSLIHDDLPALDNDDYRRGQLSCHKKFGEATAILTGDLLIAAAFTLISKSPLDHAVTAAMNSVLAQSFVDVCHGQQRDLLHGDERGSLELLHQLKTGALFRAAAHFGGLIATEDKNVQHKLAQLGEKLGVYFQIVDDLLDCSGKEAQKGRPSGSDQRNHRETFGDQANAGKLEARKHDLEVEIEQRFQQVEKQSNHKMRALRAIFEQIKSQV